MSDMIQGSGKGILAATAVGIVVGAGVALLFAPCSGRETRSWLASRTRQLRDQTSTAFELGKDAARRAAKELGRELPAGPTTLRG